MISFGIMAKEIVMRFFCFYDKLKVVKALILMLLLIKVVKSSLLWIYVLF